MHDGRMNTYTFTKDQKKITLTPLKISSLSKPKDNPKIGVSLTSLLKSQMHEYESYKESILLGQEPALASPSPHPLITLLLQDFPHIFPHEIAQGLPPKWSIQHKIDLVPSSTLPNKPAYRMNPQET